MRELLLRLRRGDGDDAYPGGLGRGNAHQRVLKNDRTGRLDADPARRGEEHLRVGLAALRW